MVQLIALFFEHELLEYSQHFFFQSKKETLAKKSAWPVEVNRGRNG